MPEYPDLSVYLHALGPRVLNQPMRRVRLGSPFVLRSVEPPLSSVDGNKVVGLSRMGKRLVFALEQQLYLVVHLMIAGRLQWKPKDAKLPARVGLVGFDFDGGTLVLTEASTRKRASLHLVKGDAALAAFDRGGLEVFSIDLSQFAQRLRSENHTLKRTLTDPRLFCAIGNAYSDEILHRAKLSPVKLTQAMSSEEIARLFEAIRSTLTEWTHRLKEEVGGGWPEKVTAFRPEMAVHGRYKKPCPVCGSPVQRIVHADNETNYCATCQTGGKLLADRSLSRLLKKDWPKTLEELEEYVASRSASL